MTDADTTTPETDATAPVAAGANPSAARPRVLVVDDEPDLLEMVGDVLSAPGGRFGGVELTSVGDLAAARRAIRYSAGASGEGRPFDLLVTDVQLPDGDGVSLLADLHATNAAARAVVMTGLPTVDKTVAALRAGAIDYLPKPFTADDLTTRLADALARQSTTARLDRRAGKLREMVRRLNVARRHVNKKVDLLCNDLVTAYGELSRQVEVVRTEEGFRTLLAGADDLEQMLCHAMDWLLKSMGFCNIAVYLAGDEDEFEGEGPAFELGAYMKYTLAGEKPLTDALRVGLLAKTIRDGSVRFDGRGPTKDVLSAAERPMLAGQAILAEDCKYLGESLAGLVLFRDAKTPFEDEHAEVLKAVAPLFAVALAGLVRRGDADDDGPDAPDDGEMPDSPGRGKRAGGPPKKDKTHDADWWKRGEESPF